MVLGVSIMALADAVQAVLTGGRTIAAGAAIGYGIFAATACWWLAWVTHRGAQRTGSPLALADAENSWRVLLEDKNSLIWKSADNVIRKEPARTFWQRFQSGFFGIFDLDDQL